MSEPIPNPGTCGADDELLAELADDFLRRHRAGGNPGVDDYAAKHPRLADQIRELFPAALAMEQPGFGTIPEVASPFERTGAIIGRYKLLERIGEGGFGVVYMAEQQQPVRRKVALKVIKPGMDTRQVIVRFEAERQALAIMDHPNIAKVFDGGMTDSGRPYFVLELVKGEPITEYCDRNEVPTRERLELFGQVCQAVQHAHQKGVIHRDIKPTNVLVAVHDIKPVVKVIDFGVAKALGQELTEKTLFTGFAQLVGTPLYMSPEQAGQSALDVDTRSDIYSLGVLLYELLTGTTPFDKERFRTAAPDEIRRIIRDEEPPKPSTRLSQSKASLAYVSARRRTDPAKLTKLVRGELDWIVMKALEKDRARRYQTANGLAMDVQRYLNDETVQACPPSTAYRLHKLARRNRRALASAAFAAVLLLAGAVGSLVYAAKQRQLAKEQKTLYDDRDRFVTEQGDSLRRLEGIQRQTQTDLYQALLRQSAALREGRQPGYRARVWANLRQAAGLPGANPNDIRREVLACLGDPIGSEPVEGTSARPAAAPEMPEQFRRLIPKIPNVHAAVAPAGKLLAVYTRDILLGDDRGKVLATADPPLGGVYDLEFTSDGRFLVAGCEEGVAVWSVPDLRLSTFYRGHNARSVAVQPGGPLIASTGSTITLWSLRSNRTVVNLRMPPAADQVAFSEDGKLLLAFRGEQVHATWHVGDTPEKLELAGHDGAVPTVAFSPDGTLLASAGKDRKVKVWDARSGALRSVGEGHQTAIESVAFSPDGAILASGDYSGLIQFWEPATGRPLGQMNAVCGQVWRLQFDAAGRYLAAGGSLGIAAWEMRQQPHGTVTAQEFLFLPTRGLVYDIAIHPGGAGLVWLDVSGGLFAVDLHQAHTRLLATGPRRVPRTLRFDPTGRFVRFSTGDGRSGTVAWPEGPPVSVSDLKVEFPAASPDGRWLAATEPSMRGLVVYDLESGREWAALPAQAAETWALSWSPDGTRLAGGLTDGGVVIWNLEQVRARLAEFGIEVPSTATRADVPRALPLAEADFDKIVKLQREFNLDRSATAYRKSLESQPDDAATHYALGGVLGRQMKVDEAIAAYRRAIELDPKHARAYNAWATLLATGSDVRFRDPERAVALAEKAVELDPTARTWQTLGWARYRAGDWKASIAAQKQSMELQLAPKGGDAGQWFCLALAHWQLGDKDEARQWYDRAVEWMEKSPVLGDTLGRFRREAAEMLGADDRPK